MSSFVLHERLAADACRIGTWSLSQVLLMNARQWPWLILVPRRPAIRELIDLDRPDRVQLMEEIAAASHALRRLYRPDKLNVAALGNVVPQLHVHVIGRFASDPAWPGPVWGSVASQPYEPEALDRRLDELRTALAPWPAIIP